MTSATARPLALVIGLTIHGLAVVRALARAGVEVHALSQGSRWRNPATYTRYGRVHMREGLNTPALLEHLQQLAESVGRGRGIVLFPTSDRMAGTIARHWPALEALGYRLSWAHCRELVLSLQDKANLPDYAARSGVRHPRSVILQRGDETLDGALEFPVVVKPTQPLSSFKALRADRPEAVREIAARYGAELPFVVQELVEGDTDSLWACTFYLDHGREIGALTSRKLAASPPGFGQGTVFATEENAEVLALGRQFIGGLDLSGPVAVEFKQDPRGRHWMIEPNAGRTEYCVDLAIQAGFNLPVIEYHHALGHDLAALAPGHSIPQLWADTDKDPYCLGTLPPGEVSRRAGPAGPVFPYRGHGDPLPLMASAVLTAAATAKASLRRHRKPPVHDQAAISRA
jgi:predicted ATP-grasp superfamily ATP-dependent carboligase